MIALVTGASSGLGRDMARILSDMGYDLVLVARRTDLLEKLKGELSTNTTVITADLSKESSCFDLYEKVKDRQIDILINNAGFGVFGAFCETDLGRELEMIDINVKGLHILTKLFVRDFKERDYGYIMNVASAAAFLPGPLFAGYYSTKAYVLRLTEAINEELRHSKSNVYIGALCPGPVKTEFDKVANSGAGKKGLECMFVSEYAIKKMFKRKMVIVPGFPMKAVHFLVRFVPERLLLKMSYIVQKNRK